MKKICIIIMALVFVCSVTSGCSQNKKKPNMIQAQRRFAKYVTPQQSPGSGFIDLSEGPKLNYDASFGPQNVNFEVKITDPY